MPKIRCLKGGEAIAAAESLGQTMGQIGHRPAGRDPLGTSLRGLGLERTDYGCVDGGPGTQPFRIDLPLGDPRRRGKAEPARPVQVETDTPAPGRATGLAHRRLNTRQPGNAAPSLECHRRPCGGEDWGIFQALGFSQTKTQDRAIPAQAFTRLEQSRSAAIAQLARVEADRNLMMPAIDRQAKNILTPKLSGQRTDDVQAIR